MVNDNEHHELAGPNTTDLAATFAPPTNNSTAANAVTVPSLNSNIVTPDPWQALRRFTRARIALGRTGSSLPTTEILDFGLAHAMARDAVHLALHVNDLDAELSKAGFTCIQAHSKAVDRANYLLRPDLGRRLDDASRDAILKLKPQQPIDLLLVVGDGLSSLAIQRHASALISEIKQAAPHDWKMDLVVIASQARVAIADEIAVLMNANMVAILIGERPGLSSPDSLGIYLTYNPQLHCSDADRNCISNIRPEGLSYSLAAKKLIWLTKAALLNKISGVQLKDESDIKDLDVL